MMVANVYYLSIKNIEDTLKRVIKATKSLFSSKGRIDDPHFLTFITSERSESDIISEIADLSSDSETLGAYIFAENELESQQKRPSPGITSISNAFEDVKFTHRYVVGTEFHTLKHIMKELIQKMMVEVGVVAHGGVKKEDIVNQLRALTKRILESEKDKLEEQAEQDEEKSNGNGHS